VPRANRLEVTERVGPDGSVLRTLDDEALEEAVSQLKAQRLQAVAVCFLHAYRNPNHEQRARAVIERLMPEAYVSLSSEVLPEFREYERLSTTVLNAYVGPRMQGYLDRFLARVRALGIEIEPYTIHSNGGLMSVRSVRAFPVRTCLSGPAAGVAGAAEVSKGAGFPNLVTFDVGGTSTDVSLVKDGKRLFTSSRMIAGYPIKAPMTDIHIIGAGGGSVAWIDDVGALKVGPHSAGAAPGPVAYGQGGTEPTITDANLCLGRLNPVALLEGRMKVVVEAARAAIMDKVADPLGMTLETAAHGILQIANANMSRAIRSVSTERGHDLREFALFAYGGAGPLHAAEVAEACNIPTVIVPQEPGTMCARGMLLSDVSLDFVRSEIAAASPETWRRVCSLFAEMAAEAENWLAQEGVGTKKQAFHQYVEARYEGQNHEVAVELPDIDPDGLADFGERFRDAHAAEYGYDIPERPVEIVNCRLQAVGRVERAPLHSLNGGDDLTSAVIDERKVFFSGGWVPTPVYARGQLPADQAFQGPAVIEEMSSTTLVLPGQTARVDALGNIIIDLSGGDGG
jgi:N-methylhydantoinase A